MNQVTHIIVSDLHLGSAHFKRAAFQAFFEQLPDDVILVLNGDTLDNPRRMLPGEHQTVLDNILRRGKELPGSVVWVEGNHDWGYRPSATNDALHVCHTYQIETRLFVTHGHDFDSLMPHHRYFIKVFDWFHRLRVLLGAPPVHVAEYAKSWSRLYGVLLRHVMHNALRFAREEACEVVTCGHVHFPEEREKAGVRYLNTGTWTESDFYYVEVSSESIQLKQFVHAAATQS